MPHGLYKQHLPSPVIVKRRLSAPGRRKSFGLELKAESRPVSSPKSCGKFPHRQALETGINGKINRVTQLSIQDDCIARSALVMSVRASDKTLPDVKVRATARASLRTQVKDKNATCNFNFRAPQRMLKGAEKAKGFTCPDCEKFAALLRSEKVKECVIEAASKHRYLCAPNDSPPNLWEPWTIDSSPILASDYNSIAHLDKSH
jgi:hypothetical protein